MDDETRDKLTDVQARYADMLMAKPNVVGVGIGLAKVNGEYTDEPALVVMVVKKVPVEELAPEELIPQSLEGVRIDVQETGVIEAF